MDDGHELARQDMVRERQRAGVTERRSVYPTAAELDGLTVELHQPDGVDDVSVLVWDDGRILARAAIHSAMPWEDAADRVRALVEEAKRRRSVA